MGVFKPVCHGSVESPAHSNRDDTVGTIVADSNKVATSKPYVQSFAPGSDEIEFNQASVQLEGSSRCIAIDQSV
jgi:hypothetical protein